jgi:hypothetical protein
MTLKYSDISVGLVVRADQSGLGYQTKALYDLLKPSKVLLIDSKSFNNREQNYEWYKNPQISYGFPKDDEVREFLKDLDVAISCEIFYNDNFTDIAKEMGVKTILQPNPELNPYVYQPTLTKPDAFFLPSTWYRDEMSKICKSYLCSPPIDIKESFQEITKEQGTLNVLHVAGRRAYMDRNGTEIVRLLGNIQGINITIHDQSASEVKDPSEIYKGNYHVMLLPRRYGGLCLPLYESLAHALPVLMPAMPPNLDILPRNWLINVRTHLPYRTKSPVRGGVTRPMDIRNRLLEFRDMDNESYQHQVNTAKDIFNSYQSNLNNWSKYIEEVLKNNT